MNELIEKTLLKESIEFNGSISELKERIRFKRDRKFKLEWVSSNEFKVLSKMSLGTLILDSNPDYFDGIRGYGKLTELNNGKTKVDLKTKLRIELYFVVTIPILAMIISYLSDKEIPLLSYFIFPIIVIFFWFIYRFQEKILFDKVRKYITCELRNAVQHGV